MSLCFAVLAVLVFPAATSQLPGDDVQTATTDQQQVAPIQRVGSNQKVKDLLKKLLEDLQAADLKVDGAEEPIGRRMMMVIPGLEDDLDAAEARVDQLLDPLQIPNLTPADAGTLEDMGVLTELTEFSDACATLALEAVIAYDTLSQPTRDETVGSKVKTIQALLPGYRSTAGL